MPGFARCVTFTSTWMLPFFSLATLTSPEPPALSSWKSYGRSLPSQLIPQLTLPRPITRGEKIFACSCLGTPFLEDRI